MDPLSSGDSALPTDRSRRSSKSRRRPTNWARSSASFDRAAQTTRFWPMSKSITQAARWKMAYPEEFFRQRIGGRHSGRAGQGSGAGGAVEGRQIALDHPEGTRGSRFRSALDDSVQPVRVTVPDEYDGTRAFPLDVAQHGRFTSLYEVETLNSVARRGDRLPSRHAANRSVRPRQEHLSLAGRGGYFRGDRVRQEGLQDRSGTDDPARVFHGRRRRVAHVAAFPRSLDGGRSRARATTRRTASRSSTRCLRSSRRCARSSTTCTSGRSMRTIFRLPPTSAKTTGALSSTTAPGNSWSAMASTLRAIRSR